MAFATPLLWGAIAALMIDSIIELSLIVDMVSWLHVRAGQSFEVANGDSQVALHGKPVHLLLNQGHTSNGAAGTAFVLIGLGGILALLLRNHVERSRSGRVNKLGLAWYHFWLVMTIPAFLLTMAALIYVFVVTNMYAGQTIDVAAAAQLPNQPYAGQVAYPFDSWTPENWFSAMLKLDLTVASERTDIHNHLVLIRGWRWNLIPMFIIQLGTTIIAFLEATHYRRNRRNYDLPESKHFLPN